MTGRPVVALAATAGTARRAVPLLALVGVGAEVVPWGVLREVGGVVPDAVVATTTEVLADLPQGVPVAVWVDDEDDVHRASTVGVEVPLSSDERLVDHGVLVVPELGIDVDRWPVVPPLVRARMRRRHDLPEQLVVAVDRNAAEVDAAASLALASAAVATGVLAPLAMALGTPLVTNRETARFLGLRHGVEVEVVGGREEADRAARRIAGHPETAASLSRRARRFAEHHLDLGRPAALVRQRLGLTGPGPAGVAPVVEDRLRELATPPGARIRQRVADALAPFPPIRGALT